MPQLTETPQPTALHTWEVPTTHGQTEIIATAGQTTVILGANGSGKSGLATWMVSSFPAGKKIQRLVAHRQIWLSTSASSLTPSARLNNGPYWESQDKERESRWKDVLGDNRNSILLLDLASAENFHNAKIAEAVEANADWSILGERPFVKLNRIMQRAGLNVSISISQLGELSTKNRIGTEYPIAMMSDGEKSGMILAGEVLTASPNAVILLDEPERHLHRAVSAPLVASALQERPDCSFVVFTHDIELANELRTSGAPTLVVTGSTWNDGQIQQWDVQPVPSGGGIPDGVVQAILGARRRVLFCEGIQGGLDDQLYTLLYPEWHVVPVGSCGEVIRSTKAMKHLDTVTWVESRGVIDADRRTEEDVLFLAQDDIWVSLAHEIENLLFLPVCQTVVAKKQADARGCDPLELLAKSHSGSVEALKLREVKDRIILQAVLADARTQLSNQVDSLTKEKLGGSHIRLEHIVDQTNFELKYDTLVSEPDLSAFMLEFPIRESGCRNAISKALLCASVDDYIAMVMVQIRRDDALAKKLCDLIERKCRLHIA